MQTIEVVAAVVKQLERPVVEVVQGAAERSVSATTWLGGVLEVPAGSGADVEVPVTEVGVVVREQAFAGAPPDEGVAPPQHDGLVHRQQCPTVWGSAGLLRLCDRTCRHACSPLVACVMAFPPPSLIVNGADSRYSVIRLPRCAAACSGRSPVPLVPTCGEEFVNCGNSTSLDPGGPDFDVGRDWIRQGADGSRCGAGILLR